MVPLGVIGYPPVQVPPATPKTASSRTGPASPKYRRTQHSERSPSSTAASFQATSDGSNINLQSPRAAASCHSSPKESPRKTSLTRPKHVPIVIPHYVPIVAPESPGYATLYSPSSASFSTDTASCPSISEFPVPGRKGSADSGRFRPRHVEIVIPSWAQPVQRLPASPAGSSISPSDRRAFHSAPAHASHGTMTRQTPDSSRTSTIDSSVLDPFPPQHNADRLPNGHRHDNSGSTGSQTNLARHNITDQTPDREYSSNASRTPLSAMPSSGLSPAVLQTAGLSTPSTSSTTNLSGLVCNVHQTTGREPHPLVGATTTVLGDKLYVFGGRRLSRTRPHLTSDLYEFDLIRRHWTKLDAKGDVPAPRYFHSVCALGDTKLVCYGGMSPAPQSGEVGSPQQQGNLSDPQIDIVVMSDVHIYDVLTQTWMNIPTAAAPQGRYAHCAAILPSSAVFASADAPLSAIHHNPASSNPNQGSIGVSLDGHGGAEMVVVGGQDSANHYIEQISIFNLRSLTWTATNTLGRSCGAYRSVVAPLGSFRASHVGKGHPPRRDTAMAEDGKDPNDDGYSMLIYSNYNFLDVKLELQIRLPDGTLTEKHMNGSYSPPGLRFPNGGIVANHFVVSGTFLTSSKQEYALWALDLRTLTWSRIDAGAAIFSQGSWNRGVLWSRRNTFVVLGNRKRSLVEDYNHRRINFTNVCMVELEAFGLYDNPRKSAPTSGFTSVSAHILSSPRSSTAGGRQLLKTAQDLGEMASGLRELADMDFIAIDGTRIPVNSHLIARRWGPYFTQLLRDGVASQDGGDTATLRPSGNSIMSRNSSITITPSIKSTLSNAPTAISSNSGTTITLNDAAVKEAAPPDARSLNPTLRPRTFYLPHTHLTIQSLVHYLYTSSLPPPSSSLCTPQILCSLLQLARPYRIDGLLEAVVERLHNVLDGRNTAAIFNAAAMAAGGGDGVAFATNSPAAGGAARLASSLLHRGPVLHPQMSASASAPADDPASAIGIAQGGSRPSSSAGGSAAGSVPRNLRIDTSVGARMAASGVPNSADDDNSSVGTSVSASELSSAGPLGSEREIWAGELSAVVGLQKRGLRGLMEGRRMRERGRSDAAEREGGEGRRGEGRVGLGIA